MSKLGKRQFIQAAGASLLALVAGGSQAAAAAESTAKPAEGNPTSGKQAVEENVKPVTTANDPLNVALAGGKTDDLGYPVVSIRSFPVMTYGDDSDFLLERDYSIVLPNGQSFVATLRQAHLGWLFMHIEHTTQQLPGVPRGADFWINLNHVMAICMLP